MAPSLVKYIVALAFFPTACALQKQEDMQGTLLRRHMDQADDSSIEKGAKAATELRTVEGAKANSESATGLKEDSRSVFATSDGHFVKRRAISRLLPQHYAKADDLIKELQSLAKGEKCAVPITTSWEHDDDSDDKKLFVVHLGKPEAPKKMMLVANTHAREAITAEVARKFIHWACEGSTAANKLLGEKSEFRITVLPVLNLSGRRVIDEGTNPCQRATADEGEGEIDLNRNMDVDFEASEGHGEQPFSTYQARILKNIVEAEKPVAYLDLHSGFRSLMVSWGSRPRTTPDFPAQNRILSKIQKEHCPDCPIGSNNLVIGYRNPGEIIDHMYEKQHIKYSTLWETYMGPDSDDCLAYFNPIEAKDFQTTVNRWTGAVRMFADDVHSNVRSDERATAAESHESMLELSNAHRMPLRLRDEPGNPLTT